MGDSMSRICLNCERIIKESLESYCSSKCELINYLESEWEKFPNKKKVLIVTNS